MDRTLSMPEIGMIAATRGMLGAGIGLLVADKLEAHRRRVVGLTLATIGAVSTIPLAWGVFHKKPSRAEP